MIRCPSDGAVLTAPAGTRNPNHHCPQCQRVFTAEALVAQRHTNGEPPMTTKTTVNRIIRQLKKAPSADWGDILDGFVRLQTMEVKKSYESVASDSLRLRRELAEIKSERDVWKGRYEGSIEMSKTFVVRIEQPTAPAPATLPVERKTPELKAPATRPPQTIDHCSWCNELLTRHGYCTACKKFVLGKLVNASVPLQSVKVCNQCKIELTTFGYCPECGGHGFVMADSP